MSTLGWQWPSAQSTLDISYGCIGHSQVHITSHSRTRMIVAYNLFISRLVIIGNECTRPDRCEFTNAYQGGPPNQNPTDRACDFPYQTLPDPVLAVRNPVVVLDWSTNAYHRADLALHLPYKTFTNLYHRDGGPGDQT